MSQYAYQFLRTTEPYNRLSEGRLELIAEKCRVISYQARQFIFYEGDQSFSSYQLISGRVAILKISSSGRELIAALLSPGETFGIMPVVRGKPYPVCARAESKSEVLVIPRPEMLELLKRLPELNAKWLELLGDRMQKLLSLASALAYEPAEVRLASAILSLLPNHKINDVAQITMPRKELAEACGMTIETASRISRRFEADGVLDLSKRGVICVRNVAALKTLVE